MTDAASFAAVQSRPGPAASRPARPDRRPREATGSAGRRIREASARHCERRRRNWRRLPSDRETCPRPWRGCASSSVRTCGWRRRNCRSPLNSSRSSRRSASWEASIEMVLGGFARSLLVPHRHYPVVSRYIDRTRLVDAGGHGQKLVYLRVGERAASSTGPAAARTVAAAKDQLSRGTSALALGPRRTGGAIRLPLLRQRRGVPGGARAGDDRPPPRQSTAAGGTRRTTAAAAATRGTSSWAGTTTRSAAASPKKSADCARSWHDWTCGSRAWNRN